MAVVGAITDTIGKDIAFENFSPFTDCLIETRGSFVVQVFTNYDVDCNCPTHFSLIFKLRKTYFTYFQAQESYAYWDYCLVFKMFSINGCYG